MAKKLAPLFDGVDQTQMIMDGHEVVVPLRYHSGTAMVAIFAAKTAALRAKAPHPSLRPASMAPGVSPVAVIGFEFVTDIGPVNEICVAVPLKEQGRLHVPAASLTADLARGRMPAWIWHLPVSTDIANTLGIQAWGFPKIHGDIPIGADADGTRTAALSHNGVPVLELTAPAVTGTRSVNMTIVNHLWQDGSHVQRADHDFRFRQAGLSVVPGAAHLTLHPEHPIADDLGDVLISRQSLAYLFAGELQALLGSPQVLTPRLLQRLGDAASRYDERHGADVVRSAA